MSNTTNLSGFGGWLDKIRTMVPTRTMALYLAITATYAWFWPVATDLPVWVPFVVVGLCLAVQVIVGIARKKKGWAIALSAIAFVLFGMTTPYSGILGVFEAPGSVNFVFAAVVIAYCLIIPALWTGNLAEEAAGL
jgi:hypothetical protein